MLSARYSNVLLFQNHYFHRVSNLYPFQGRYYFLFSQNGGVTGITVNVLRVFSSTTTLLYLLVPAIFLFYIIYYRISRRMMNEYKLLSKIDGPSGLPLVDNALEFVGDSQNKFEAEKLVDKIDDVDSFFRRKSIFITGATGFVGKTLIEKLLRSFPDLEAIYLLLRNKGDQSAASRLQKIVDCELFSLLKLQRPEALPKLKIIPGDIAENDLGISDSDRQILIDKVNVVFHSAATVRFDEDLKVALNINVQGTKRLIELCKSLKHLEALVHVSTAFSNCNLSEIDEIIYPAPYDVEKIIQVTSCMNKEQIAKHTSEIIGDWPNTYTFTKALSEHVVAEAREDLPITIIRPSIILSSASDPFPGWVQSWNGTNGFVGAGSRGLSNCFFTGKEKVVESVPIDVVVNLLICSAWALAYKKMKNLTIYNCCVSYQKPLKLDDFTSMCLFYIREYPSEKVFWYPEAYTGSNRLLYTINRLFLQVFPAYFIDTITIFTKSKIKLVPIYKKISEASETFEYFRTRNWRFKNRNFVKLSNLLSKTDSKTFLLDISNICWSSYLENYVLGIRKHVLGESVSTIPKARKMLKRYKLARLMIRFALVISISISISICLFAK